MKRKLFVIAAAAILLLAIGGLIGYQSGLFERGLIRLPAVQDCALHLEACSTPLPAGGELTFEINPRRPSPTDPLVLHARFDQAQPQRVSVRFKGVNMNMGHLEHFAYEMQKNESAGAAVSFTGAGGVFACSSNRMQWLALVKLQFDDAVYEVPFKFETLQKIGEK